MRAYKGTLVALNTIFRYPFGDVDSNAAFFVSRGSRREGPVFTSCKCTYRQIIAFLGINRHCNFLDKLRKLLLCFWFINSIRPFGRYVYLNQVSYASIDGIIVHLNDFAAFFAISLFNRIFQVFDRIFNRNYISQFEKRSLHNHINSVS